MSNDGYGVDGRGVEDVYLGHAVVDDERFAGSPGPFRNQRLMEHLFLDFEQFGNGGHDGHVLDRHRLVVVVGRFVRLELDVTDVQDGRQDGEDAPLGVVAETHHLHRLLQSRQLEVGVHRLTQIMIITL